MVHQYTLFVDEAGDDKVDNLKPDYPSGNSEWLCLGGYLVRQPQEQYLDERRDALLLEIGGKRGGTLHYRNLKDRNRIKVCEKLATFPARGFVLCSYKRTMLGHSNPRAAAASTGHNDYVYNFVGRLLLERVTEFVDRDAKLTHVEKPVLRIVFANRKGHHFGHFKAYLLQLIHQARAGNTYISTRVIKEHVLRYGEIDRAPASLNSGLQLADSLVSAFFQGLERSSPKYSHQPAHALKHIIATNTAYPNRRPTKANFGLTLYPAAQAFEHLDKEQKQFFEEFGYDFARMRKQASGGFPTHHLIPLHRTVG